MSDNDTAVAEADAITRTPNDPVELVQLKGELEAEIRNCDERINRANMQKAKHSRRLASVNEKLDEKRASGLDMTTAVRDYIVKEEKAQADRFAALRKEFNVS